MYVKICGLVNRAQIDQAITLGYDAMGIVTYSKSRRFCSPTRARELAHFAKGRIDTFIVGKSYHDVQDAADAFDYIQIYEALPLPNLVLASDQIPPPDLNPAYFMYDSSAGSGVFNEIPSWLKGITLKVIVAGGLNHENVCRVIEEINPFGVDISSGVETDGIKDVELMRQFIATVRHCKKH